MKIISKGEFSTGEGFLMAVVLAGFIAFCIGCSIKLLSDPFLQLDDLFGGIVLTVLLVYIIIRGGREYKVVNVYDTHLMIRWAWGLFHRKILPEQITLFSLSTKEESTYFIIRIGQQDYLFLQSKMSNAIELTRQIKAWGIRRRDNIHFEIIPSREAKLGGILTMMLAIFALILGIHATIRDDPSIDENSLVTVKGTLQSAPEIKERSLRSAAEYVSFALEEYPDYEFTISGAGFEAVDFSAVKNGKSGDQIVLRISIREFSIKIRKNIFPSFSERHFGWKRIKVIEVHLGGSPVLTLENYNYQIQQSKGSYGFAIFLYIGLAAFLFFFGFRQWRR